jgi:hypothetical protein
VIRPGVQANDQESAQRLTADGANQVCFTIADAHQRAAQRLVMSESEA